jgi:hypothetical protein
MEKFMMRNSAGNKDAMFTVSIISFVIVSAVVVASMFDSLTIFGTTIDFSEPNVPLLTLYLGTCFSSYVFRRTTKDKLEKKVDDDTQYLTTDEFEEHASNQEAWINEVGADVKVHLNEMREDLAMVRDDTIKELAITNKKNDVNLGKLKDLFKKHQESVDKKITNLSKKIDKAREVIAPPEEQDKKKDVPEVF